MDYQTGSRDHVPALQSDTTSAAQPSPGPTHASLPSHPQSAQPASLRSSEQPPRAACGARRLSFLSSLTPIPSHQLGPGDIRGEDAQPSCNLRRGEDSAQLLRPRAPRYRPRRNSVLPRRPAAGGERKDAVPKTPHLSPQPPGSARLREPRPVPGRSAGGAAGGGPGSFSLPSAGSCCPYGGIPDGSRGPSPASTLAEPWAEPPRKKGRPCSPPPPPLFLAAGGTWVSR